MRYVIVTVAAFVTAALLTPLAIRLSIRFGIVVSPGGRRKHKGDMPLLGGIPLFVAYLLAIGLTLWLIPFRGDDFRPIRGLILGTIFVFIGGLLDDRYELDYRLQFLIQFGAALIANLHVAFLERVSNPFPTLTHIPIPGLILDPVDNLIILSTPLAWLITTLWIVGIINAVNFFDGVDGLAAGVGAIACVLFAWHGFFKLGQTTIPTLSLVLAAALLGFLIFNFPPATIYLGSAGVYLLAYNLSTLSLLAPAKLATALLVLALPILDGLWRAFDRIRHGRNPFSGDRGHLHFILLDQGWPPRKIIALYYSTALLFGLIALFAPSGLPKLLTFATLAIIILIFLARHTRGHWEQGERGRGKGEGKSGK